MIESIDGVYQSSSWGHSDDPSYNCGGLVDRNTAKQRAHSSQEAAYSQEKLEPSAMFDSHSGIRVHRLGSQVAVRNDEVLYCCQP